jgi:threonyl-tRNA synthetase
MAVNQNQLKNMRHSCSHVLAAAVLELYPQVKFGIGPAIEDGFYYDFDFGKKKISEKDLEKISAKMAEIIKVKHPFKKEVVSIKKAQAVFKNQPFKLELIKDLVKEGEEKVSLYHLGDPSAGSGQVFTDLCAGPHVADTGKIGAFKLLSIAGAYWRGSEKNKMLTRIYGTCFSTQKELDSHLKMLEEAKERDHRKIGKELDLFHFSPIAPGMPFWHPKGMILWNELAKFVQEKLRKYEYQEVKAPELHSINVFKQSGHYDHYKDFMFFTEWDKGEVYALKPMDCPGEIEIYKQRIRSYRELPLRWAEFGLVHRKEKKGELNGLFRVAHVTQDDAHIFVTEEQIQEEISQLLKLTTEVYQPFGFSYKVYLSTQPDDFMGNPKLWQKAEKALKDALKKNKTDYEVKEGEGAFYGPKIDYDLQDALGRGWQCATHQLDFFMPEKFNLRYIGKSGKEIRPIMIHRTIIGSLERFIGVLIEHYAGAFPTWLAPVQVVVIPITDKQLKYAQEISQQLKEKGFRVELDDRNETTSAKIRDAEIQKVPYMLILGEKEVKAKNVSVRARSKGDLGQIKLERFIKKISEAVEKKLPL